MADDFRPNLAPDLLAAGLKLCRACTTIETYTTTEGHGTLALGARDTRGCEQCAWTGRKELWRLVITYPGAGVWHNLWLEFGRPGNWGRVTEWRLMREQADDLARQLDRVPAVVVVDRRGE